MCRSRVAYLLLILVLSANALQAKEPKEDESISVLVAKLELLLERLDQVERRLQMLEQVNGRPESALIVPAFSLPHLRIPKKRQFDPAIEQGMMLDALKTSELSL